MVAVNQELILLAVKINISIDDSTTNDFVYFFFFLRAQNTSIKNESPDIPPVYLKGKGLSAAKAGNWLKTLRGDLKPSLFILFYFIKKKILQPCKDSGCFLAINWDSDRIGKHTYQGHREGM